MRILTTNMDLIPNTKEGSTITDNEGPYGIHESMVYGLKKHKDTLTHAHPLESSEKQWNSTREKSDFSMLRNTQGIHMPLRLRMELHAVNQVQRLPCLHSSNLMRNTLTRNDDMIGFDDVLNNPADSEVMGAPHMMMERKLGLL